VPPTARYTGIYSDRRSKATPSIAACSGAACAVLAQLSRNRRSTRSKWSRLRPRSRRSLITVSQESSAIPGRPRAAAGRLRPRPDFLASARDRPAQLDTPSGKWGTYAWTHPMSLCRRDDAILLTRFRGKPALLVLIASLGLGRAPSFDGFPLPEVGQCWAAVNGGQETSGRREGRKPCHGRR
jgi:hypothetical protein